MFGLNLTGMIPQVWSGLYGSNLSFFICSGWKSALLMQRWRVVGCWRISSGAADGSLLYLCKSVGSSGAGGYLLALQMAVCSNYVKLEGRQVLEDILW